MAACADRVAQCSLANSRVWKVLVGKRAQHPDPSVPPLSTPHLQQRRQRWRWPQPGCCLRQMPVRWRWPRCPGRSGHHRSPAGRQHSNQCRTTPTSGHGCMKGPHADQAPNDAPNALGMYDQQQLHLLLHTPNCTNIPVPGPERQHCHHSLPLHWQMPRLRTHCWARLPGAGFVQLQGESSSVSVNERPLELISPPFSRSATYLRRTWPTRPKTIH